MKKLLALVSLLFAGSAMANGPFDGVYQSPLNPKSFLLVQQSGNSLLVSNYYAITSVTNVSITVSGATFKPSELHVWDAFMTHLETNNKAVGYGEVVNSMCSAKVSVSFAGSEATLQILEITQTAAGGGQNVPCSQIRPVGSTITGRRVF